MRRALASLCRSRGGRALTQICWIGLACAGCGDDHPAGTEPQSVECGNDEACGEGQLCDDGTCIPTICSPGTSSCATGARAIIHCDDGLEASLIPCPGAERCSMIEGHAACLATTCLPEAWSCSGDVAERCGSDGNSVAETIDCALDFGTCRDGRCVRDDCPDRDDCQPRACSPGERACDGNVVTVCNESGDEFVATGQDCEDDNAACFAGVCRERVCEVPHECDPDGVSLACVENGTKLEPETCGPATQTFCSSETGRCEPYVCLPGTPACDDTRASRCDDAGSGPVPGGVDCADQDKACWGGGCASVVCTSKFVCNDAELLRCTQNGTALVHESECGDGTVCDAELGACAPTPCMPNAPVCGGSVATTCRTSGMGFEPGGTDCAVAAKTCMAGLCVDRVCEPHALFCDGEELHECDALGGSSGLVDECGELETCDAAQGACVPHVCEPGQPLCDGDVLTTCALDGLGPAPGGEDCSLSGKVCDLDACKPLVCAPSSSFCDDEVVYQCHPSGSASAPVQVCENGTHCEDSVDGASCVTDS